MDRERSESGVEQKITQLSAIRDVKQRSFALANKLNELNSDAAVNLIKTIRERAVLGDSDYLRLYNGLLFSGVVADVLGQTRMSQMVEAAQGMGEFEVVSILLDIPPETAGDVPFQPFLDADLRETPLGTRKALARKPDFKLIKRIARDQDHRVIKHLLNNPRLTEADVTRIAATRPTSPKVLEEIYNHPRWVTRYSVKKVIILNPFSPPSLSLRLLTFMSLQDLEEICRSPDLSSLVMREAGRMADRKGGYYPREHNPSGPEDDVP